MKPHQLFFRNSPSEVPKAANRVIIISIFLVALFFVFLFTSQAARISSWYSANNAVWHSGTMRCGIATDNDVVDRFWQINVQHYSANPTAAVDFYYNTGEIQTIPETELKVQRWNSAAVSACNGKHRQGNYYFTLRWIQVTNATDLR